MAKISIKLASKGNNQFDLSSNHITTSDFGQIQVSHFLPVIPNDKITCSLSSEARFAPMVVPTFMDVKLITRSFFVPMSAIYQPFEYFYTDRHDASVFKTLPTFTNAQLITFLTTIANGCMRIVPGDQSYDAFDGSYYYVYTEKGRIFKKLLNSLGYSWNFDSNDTTILSLLPILAFARIAYDYIYPSQYLDGLGITKYFKISSSSDYSDCFGSGPSAFFAVVLNLLTLPYKQDYFTAAWANLNASGTSYQNFSKAAPDGSQFVSSNDNVRQNSGTSTLSQYGVNMLQRLYEFVTRNNIVGVRYADQLFARFGIGSRRSDPDMSQFIGQSVQPIRVVDVTAMTAANGQDLGDLAGKAYLQGGDKLFSFDSIDEFGYILSLSFIMPEIGYYQGRKRWTTCQSRFDFVVPEFDMQMRAIRNDELFADFTDSNDYQSAQNYGGNPSNRFAFAPNYSEFKKGDDYLTGDFRINSLSRNLNSYHLFRDLPIPSSDNPLALNANFLFMQQHEFDKIFAQVYALRAPYNLVRVNAINPYLSNALIDDLVYYGDKPIVCLIDANDTSKGGFVLASSNGSIQPMFFSLANLSSKFGINLSDESTFYNNPYSVDDQTSVNWYDFSGRGLRIRDFTANTTVKESSSGSSVDVYYLNYYDGGMLYVRKYEEFISYYYDYIDHIYLKHHFNIKASRSLVPISDEFMIEDGGNKVSVDMNGNRIV